MTAKSPTPIDSRAPTPVPASHPLGAVGGRVLRVFTNGAGALR